MNPPPPPTGLVDCAFASWQEVPGSISVEFKHGVNPALWRYSGLISCLSGLSSSQIIVPWRLDLKNLCTSIHLVRALPQLDYSTLTSSYMTPAPGDTDNMMNLIQSSSSTKHNWVSYVWSAWSCVYSFHVLKNKFFLPKLTFILLASCKVFNNDF